MTGVIVNNTTTSLIILKKAGRLRRLATNCNYATSNNHQPLAN
jgi:hypothetical protein